MTKDFRLLSMSTDSIWSLVSEADFRNSLVTLEQRTNAVPTDVQKFEPRSSTTVSSDLGRLPFAVEQRFANDIAFLAAVNEGAQSVAAVCLEQHVIPQSKLTLRIAAADTIDTYVRSTLRQICDTVQRVCDPGDSAQSVQEEIFALIVNLHSDRLLGRLRSIRWQKPKYLIASHKKPLWKDFTNVTHRAHHIFPSRKDRTQRELVENLLLELANHYEQFESAEQSLDVLLQTLVRRTFACCKDMNIQDFYERLSRSGATAQISAALKCMHQLEKIGSYKRIADDLIDTANQYPSVFSHIDLEYLTPYPTQPTTIAYEPWAKTCHVHAEIQLLVDFDMRCKSDLDAQYKNKLYIPRVIGTSKYFCYLCYLFIKEHGHFFAANTHGRLYDQWTVPDLPEYDMDIRMHYAEILLRMAEIMRRETGNLPFWRPEPMTSRQNLLSVNEGEIPREDAVRQNTESLAERMASGLTI